MRYVTAFRLCDGKYYNGLTCDITKELIAHMVGRELARIFQAAQVEVMM